MADQQVQLKPITTRSLGVEIRGISPLICHRFSEKARKMIRDKKSGQKAKVREACDPEAEFENATYKLTDGTFGIPATAIKNAMTAAAHKDMGIPRTTLRRALFIEADDTPPGDVPLVRLDAPERIMREDVVRVGQGGTDLRYRPEFPEWSIQLRIEFDTEWLQPDTVVALLQRAGFGIGLCEWRPERDGDFGRFEIATDGGAS